MKKEQVIAKLTAAVKKSKSKIANRADLYVGAGLVSARNEILNQATKVSIRNVSGLTYVKRDNQFGNSSGSCGFNPETMEGHSYRWFSLVKKIKGKVVLNTFQYSQQTAKHINKTERVLNDLGIKFATVQAPRGLQDLDAALKHELSKQADLYVSTKYGRTKASKAFLKGLETPKGATFKTLASLGKRATKSTLKAAIGAAELTRSVRLSKAKVERAMVKAMRQIQIIYDRQGAMHRLNDGVHVTLTSQWNWNGFEFIGRISDVTRSQAVSQGLTKIYVHGADAQTIQVVNTPEAE